MPFSERARRLILDAESFDPKVNYPGLKSGPTFGYGYDIGQRTEDIFAADWKALLSPVDFAVLLDGVGVTGAAAKTFCARSDVKRITIRRADADSVFTSRDIPRYVALARHAFPGFDALPLDAQGALVSLVFNRGAALAGPARVEMECIHDILADGVQRGDLALIATQLREMKRLWIGKNMGGLIARREAEAQLVESCIGVVG